MKNPSSANPARTGSLNETPIREVLSGVEGSGQDARVWFETEYGMGEVLFRKGQMVKARLGGARAQTALLRLMTVNEGRFGIEDCIVAEGAPIVQSVGDLAELHRVREAEWKELCGKAPPLTSVLRLTASGSDVRDSARGIQRVVLVLIDGRRTLMQVLEESSFDPVEVLKVVARAVDDDLVQIAPQGASLLPLAPAGDASGVLPRFATADAVPGQVPISPTAEAGPPSWRHATLVGIGTKASKKATDGGLAPAPIIDVTRRDFSPQRSDDSGNPDARSLVKTVIHGFGAQRLEKSEPERAVDTSRGIATTEQQLMVPRPKPFRAAPSDAPRQRIVDIASNPAEPAPLTQFNSYSTNPRRPIAEGASQAAAGAQRRYVGRYEILLRLGRGGMGTVYLARLTSSDVGFRRLFALKLLRSHLSQDAQAAKEFLEEAKVAGVLHHANVVAVCDAGFHGKQPYLVMEYVEGCSFKQLMQASPQHLPHKLLPIMIDALSGLHAAHVLQDDAGSDLRLVHCDVSPENMLVGVDGTCRLTDFGMVKQASRLLGTTTKGKPGYVAPERINGERFDHRSDIFSMGVVLWGALTGKRLFEGETIEETVEQVCRKPLTPPSASGASCSSALDAVVMRALARNPKERFESAEEMAAELLRVARDCEGLATPKEVASWVKEAAGAELTQRRLAILDASRNSPSIPAPAGEDVARAVRMTDEMHQSGSPSGPLSIDSSIPPGPPSDVPSGLQEQDLGPSSSMIDVASLFYDRDGVLPLGRNLVSSSPPPEPLPVHKAAKFGISGRLAWTLVAILALVVGIILFFLNARVKSSTRSQRERPVLVTNC